METMILVNPKSRYRVFTSLHHLLVRLPIDGRREMVLSLSSSSSSPFFLLLQSFSHQNHFPTRIQTVNIGWRISSFRSTMSTALQPQPFGGNPLRSRTPKPGDPFSPNSALERLKTHLLESTHEGSSPNFKVLPVRDGRPLACSSGSTDDLAPVWHLGWISLDDCKKFCGSSGTRLSEDSFVYLGSEPENDLVYWAFDVSAIRSSVFELGVRKFCFVELRTLMVATDWADAHMMEELAIAGHARASLEWYNISRFCGHCGERTVPKEAGRWKECSNESCKKSIYPRVDPVVIMLIIDRENDRALLSRRSRFVPRMWSCIAGFTEPGESLEEAVRRETWEETGIEVGEVVYHSSQPWPVGPSSLPCQLMVGFFAYAKSFKIHVDNEELQDAQWHSREDVKKALTFAEYEKAQRTAVAKVDQMCKGIDKGQNISADYDMESGELAPMFVPGPFSIVYHMISSWINQGTSNGTSAPSKQPSSMSNL